MADFQTPGQRKPPPTGTADTPADLRALETAAQETPPKLRNLEQRWRQLRRASLCAKPHVSVPARAEPSSQVSITQRSTTLGVATQRTQNYDDLVPLLAAPIPVGTHTLSPGAHLIIDSPPSPAELTILLPNKKVTVVRGGRQMITVGTDINSEHAMVTELDLDLASKWDAEDVKQWMLASELLAKLKSRLPLLKMYLTNGHLSLMSNRPSDLILSTPVKITDTTGPSSLEGRLRMKYSRQSQLLRSSLRLTSPEPHAKEPDVLHIHRQLSLSHLFPDRSHPDGSTLVHISPRQGIGRLSRFEEDGLRQIQQMRPVWETIERQWQ